eukprot:Skav221548  [mRNA]  locus=scaffold1376:26409:42408:- [translate_table: standard]
MRKKSAAAFAPVMDQIGGVLFKHGFPWYHAVVMTHDAPRATQGPLHSRATEGPLKGHCHKFLLFGSLAILELLFALCEAHAQLAGRKKLRKEAAMENFKAGEDVFVFYRMTKRCRPDRKYLAVLDPRHGAYRPRCGISDGWVPARVVADQNEKDHYGDVKVEYTWPFFFTQRGHMADGCSGWTEWFPAHYVRRDENPKHQRLGATRPKLVPGLSDGRRIGSSVSDIFIDSYCDHFQQHISTDYEAAHGCPTCVREELLKCKKMQHVWTVYIEDKSDMDKLADTAHLLFSCHHPLRRADKVCAMYHLYPTGFEEHCVPTSETGGDGGAALVDQKAFFRMMQAVERAGIPSRFPHDSGLYELLASKRWTYYMALETWHILARTLGRSKKAAFSAYKALTAVRRKQQALRGEPSPSHLAAIEISDELTGQPHDLENLIVQEFVDHDLELRLYVVDGEARWGHGGDGIETTIYTKFCKIKPNNEFGDFKAWEAFTDAEAAQWIGGDLAALQDGERQCRRVGHGEITAHWMEWVNAQTCQTPPGIRFDYFVGRTSEPGKAVVRTLEICELGFSMLGKKAGLPKKVFSAMLRACLEDVDLEDLPCEAPEAVLEQNGSSMPSVLYITVPRVSHGTPDQVKCTGKYDACVSPAELRGPWERGPGWDAELGILVTTDPEAW